MNSSFGLALRGIRENARRMPAIGSDHRAHLQKIYTISAAMADAAGALLTQTTDTVSPDTLSFNRSADVVVMLILGWKVQDGSPRCGLAPQRKSALRSFRCRVERASGTLL